MILSPDIVANLTGRKQPKRQIQWLAANGWTFEIGGDGLPKIDEEYYRERMGAKRQQKRRVVRTEGLSRGSQTHTVS